MIRLLVQVPRSASCCVLAEHFLISLQRTSEKVKLEITNHFSAMTESIEETLRVVIEIIGGEQQAALSQAKTIRAQLEQKCMELREKKLQLEILASKSDNFKLVQVKLLALHKPCRVEFNCSIFWKPLLYHFVGIAMEDELCYMICKMT